MKRVFLFCSWKDLLEKTISSAGGSSPLINHGSIPISWVNLMYLNWITFKIYCLLFYEICFHSLVMFLNISFHRLCVCIFCSSPSPRSASPVSAGSNVFAGNNHVIIISLEYVNCLLGLGWKLTGSRMETSCKPVGSWLEADWKLAGSWLEADWKLVGSRLETSWKLVGSW